MVAKKYQNPSGGLNEAGRKYFKRTTGANLKRPCLLYTSPSPRDAHESRMPSSA